MRGGRANLSLLNDLGTDTASTLRAWQDKYMVDDTLHRRGFWKWGRVYCVRNGQEKLCFKTYLDSILRWEKFPHKRWEKCKQQHIDGLIKLQGITTRAAPKKHNPRMHCKIFSEQIQDGKEWLQFYNSSTSDITRVVIFNKSISLTFN